MAPIIRRENSILQFHTIIINNLGLQNNPKTIKYPRIVSVFPSMVLVSVFQKGYNRDKLVKEVLYDH